MTVSGVKSMVNKMKFRINIVTDESYVDETRVWRTKL